MISHSCERPVRIAVVLSLAFLSLAACRLASPETEAPPAATATSAYVAPSAATPASVVTVAVATARATVPSASTGAAYPAPAMTATGVAYPGPAATSSADALTLTIAHTNDVNGETQPCG